MKLSKLHGYLLLWVFLNLFLALAVVAYLLLGVWMGLLIAGAGMAVMWVLWSSRRSFIK